MSTVTVPSLSKENKQRLEDYTTLYVAGVLSAAASAVVNQIQLASDVIEASVEVPEPKAVPKQEVVKSGEGYKLTNQSKLDMEAVFTGLVARAMIGSIDSVQRIIQAAEKEIIASMTEASKPKKKGKK